MWHGFCRVFLTAVWFGSKMRPNPHGKSHHFLSKCPGNSMTWTCLKSISCLSMENKLNLDKWHGIVMKLGVDLDQTTTKSSCAEKWYGISMRIHVTFFTGKTRYPWSTLPDARRGWASCLHYNKKVCVIKLKKRRYFKPFNLK